MTKQQAKDQDFTHLVRFFGYKAYWDSRTNEVTGTTWWNDFMIGMCLWWYINFYQNLLTPEGQAEYFRIDILEKL